MARRSSLLLILLAAPGDGAQPIERFEVRHSYELVTANAVRVAVCAESTW